MVSFAAVFLALLPFARSEQSLSAFNPLLDPSRLTWWRTQWSPAPVLLSVNNKDRAGVVATFYFTPSTSLSNGVVEVTFPSGFTLPGQADGQVVQVSGQALSSGSDQSVSITGVTNPAKSGAYGPFALRTRAFPGGQTVDVNLNFGFVYITSDPGTLGAMSVTLSGSVINPVVNKSGNTLSFKFTIAVSLWKFDSFVVSTDGRWTVAQSGTCASADYAGRWNNFNGTSAANPHLLSCLITPKGNTGQTIYVYGLAVDGIDTALSNDNKYVDLRVTGVTTPAYVYASHLYTWTVATYRFGSTTILETGTVTSGPTVLSDTISAAVWTPTWGALPTEVPFGASAFMDLSFSLSNAMPAGGSLEISVTEDITTGDTRWTTLGNCYIVTFINKATACTVTANKITVTGMGNWGSGKSVVIRNVVKITSTPGSTAQINSIKTYQGEVSSSVLIDSGQNLASFKVTDAVVRLNTFNLRFLDSSVTATTAVDAAGGTGDYRQGAQFTAVPSPIADLTTNSVVTINCPFTAGVEDFAIGVPSASYWYKDDATTSEIDMLTGRTALTMNAPTLTLGSAASPQGALTVSGSIGTVAAGMHLLAFQPSAATSFITLPRVVNNLATAYECRASIVTAGKSTHRAALRFSVTAQTWTTSSFTLPCTSNVDGMPAILSVTPAVLPVQASSNAVSYYVEVEFAGTTDFNCGVSLTAVSTPHLEDVLSFSVAYPHSTSSASPTVARLYTASGSAFVAITGLDALSTGASFSAYFPIGGWSPGTITPTLRSFAVFASDPRYKFITHQKAMSAVTTVAPATPFPSAAVVGSSNSFVNQETVSAPGLVLNLAATSLVAGANYLYFVFPAGYVWSAPPTVSNLAGTATTYTNVRYFSSPVASFRYPGALVDTVVSGSAKAVPTTASASGTISIAGFIAPLGSANSNLSIVLGPSPAGGVCVNTKVDFPLSSTAGVVSILQVTPTTTKSRGPDGVAVTQVVTFTLPHGVPLAGNIALGLGSQWDVVADTRCEVTGIAPVAGGSLSCSFTGRSISITNFADFSTARQTQVSVQVTGLLPPLSVSSFEFVASLSSSSSTSVIDSAQSFQGTTIAVTASSVSGTTEWQQAATLPSFAGAKAVDLYLRFLLPHSIPVSGVLTVSSPLSIKYFGPARNKCFLSPVYYSSCVTTGSTVEITLGQVYAGRTVLELFLDEAVDNPENVSPSGAFTVSTKWGGVVIDADAGTPSEKQRVVATAAPTGLLTPVSLSLSPSNSCELSTHVFSFKSSAPFSPSDRVYLTFPPQYDHYLGEASLQFSSEPSAYYIQCSSEQLGAALCTVDHHTVILAGSASVDANTAITVSIEVRNPGAGVTEQFQVFHVSSSGDYKAVNQRVGAVTIQPLAGSLDIRSLELSNTLLQTQAVYKWRLYLTDTMQTDSQLQVLFPPEYDLSTLDGQDSYTCASTWTDISITSTVKTAQDWNPATTCVVHGNRVVLPAPTAAAVFTNTKTVAMSVADVGNPHWGRARSQVATAVDFDIVDTQWTWTSKFDFFVFRSATNAYTSRSYPNLNAAYARFNRQKRQIQVNNYQPLGRTGRIMVYPGTQTTDMYISTSSAAQPMAAKQVIFTPVTNSATPDNSRLSYSSKRSQWTLRMNSYRILFRVAAAADTPKGLYYVDWSGIETRGAGIDQDLYDPPTNTLVEVVKRTEALYSFKIAQISPVQVGLSSVPVSISVSNAPHNLVQVEAAVSGDVPNITVSPAKVSFTPDVNEAFFQVKVAASYVQGDTQTLLFSLSGTDAFAYQIAPSLTFTILPRTALPAPGSVVGWGLADLTRTSASFTLSTDQLGVVYYIVAAQGSAIPSFSTVKSAVAESTTSPPIETDPQSGESWTAFQQRIYAQHLQSQWLGSLVMSTTVGTTVTVIDWLAAETSYQIAAFLDNMDPSVSPEAKVVSFTTKALPDCQQFTVRFTGAVPQSYEGSIIRELAKVQGVDSRRIVPRGYSAARRQLQSSTTFTFVLLADRYMDSPTPEEQAKLSDSGKATLSASLLVLGITNALEDVRNGSPVTRTVPQWTVPPRTASATQQSVEIELRATVAGRQCCVALLEASSPQPWQVTSGLGPTNSPAPSSCIATDLSQPSNTLQVSSLSSDSLYYVYCTATDDYPLWPTYMQYVRQWSPVEVRTLGQGSVGEVDSGGLAGCLGLIILVA